jgi:DNA-binding beta-propeller fold protein YncE
MPSAIQALILCALASAAAWADAAAYGDAKGVSLKAPQGVACTAEGRVVVADTGNKRLLPFVFKDGTLTPGAPIAFPELGSPARVQIDSRGNVLVLDARARRIVRVSDDGRFGGFVTPKGVPQAKGFFPLSFRVGPQDDLYVLDAASSRVVVLDKAGAFLRAVPAPAGVIFADIAIDPAKGTVFAVDGRAGKVYAGAEVLASVKDLATYATTLEVAPHGRLLVADNHGHALITLAADGSFLGKRSGMGWNEGLIYYPEQLCADAQGDVFVADRGNNRVQVFVPAQ